MRQTLRRLNLHLCRFSSVIPRSKKSKPGKWQLSPGRLVLPGIVLGLLIWSLFGVNLSQAANVAIDTFETDQPTLTLTSAGTTTASSSAPASPPGAGILGGERDIRIERTGPAGPTLEVGVSSNVLFYGHSPGVTSGLAEIHWDGPDNDPLNLDTTGLGGLDLTAGGTQDAFLFRLSNDLATSITINIYTGAGTSSFSLDLPNFNFTFQDFTIPFTDFTGSADFTDVGAITLTISSQTPLDLRMDTFETTSTKPPEEEEEEEEEEEPPEERPRYNPPSAPPSSGGGGGGGPLPTTTPVPIPTALPPSNFPTTLPETGDLSANWNWFNGWPAAITGIGLAAGAGLSLLAFRKRKQKN